MYETPKDFKKWSWDKQVTHVVNQNQDRIKILEKQVAKLQKNKPLRTVRDLAANKYRKGEK